MKIFSKQDILHLLPMAEAINLMHTAYGQLASGRAIVPVRTHIQVLDNQAEALFMPAFLPDQYAFSLKMVALHPQNAKRGLPFIRGLVLLMSAVDGTPMALLEGGSVTALRTGAGSGMASSLLAAPHASVLAIFGAGTQAFPQIEAVAAIRPIRHVMIFNRSQARAEALADQIHGRWPRMELEINPDRTALRRAHIICTATRSDMPLFEAGDVAPGTHINAIGAYRPDLAEIPPALCGSADIFVDELEACLQEAGDLLQAVSGGYTQPKAWRLLGSLLFQPSPWQPDRTTIFKSVGNAAQDLVVAHSVWQRGQALGRGTQVDF